MSRPVADHYTSALALVVLLAVIGFGALLTIVTVALGDIAEDLDSSRTTLTWAITGTMLAVAVGSPVAGKLGDVHGHRRLFLIGLASGTALTALSGIAWNALSLIAFRALFGLTGAMVMTSAMALMIDAFGRERRATAMGWFQFAATGAATVGVIIGGPLIGLLGWRLVFQVFAGIELVALVLGALIVRSSPPGPRMPIDYAGAATSCAGVLAGLLAISRITGVLRDDGLGAVVKDPLTWGLLAACTTALITFVRVEQRVPNPLIKPAYFRRRAFTLPLTSNALLQFAYMGGFVVTPALLEYRYGWGLGAIALLLCQRPAAFSAAAPLGGYLAGRIGEKRPIVAGGILMVTSMVAFVAAATLTSPAGIALIAAGLVLSGAAAGVSQPSVSAMAVGAVDDSDVGVANGMSQQMMFVGILAGIQTMNVLVGDQHTVAQFVASYVVGAIVAFAGVVVSSRIRGDTSPGVPRHATVLAESTIDVRSPAHER